MSVYASHRGGGRAAAAERKPRPATAFLWMVSILSVAAAISFALRESLDPNGLVQLASWAAIVAAVDMLPVRVWESVTVSMSFPVALAAGMIFSPAEAALIAFVGSFDPRELSRHVSLAKSIFNRSQVAASVMAGAVVFHALGGTITEWPDVLVPGVVALLVDSGVNFLLVASAVAIEDRLAPRGVLLRMFGASPWHYLAGYLLLGLLALPLSAAFATGGVWAVLLFLAPLVLAREMFRQTKQFIDATERIRLKDVAILGAAGEVVRERKDERLAIAGELHDEVLPSLFKVHLMGQVLRQDLAAGKLLELDDDLPQLLLATDAAQRAIRDLLGDLRRSPLGASGLIPTLRLLVDQLASAGAPPVTLDVEQCDCSPLAQLLAYQAIREALHNAAKHSRASSIEVRLWTDEALLRLSVTDDGTGFSLATVDGSRHFGLQIMKERFEAAGGILFIDSRLGVGTLVAASVPRNA
jgi:signal transduction histidine kinase